ncbi:MAG TPA: hypothetical protein VF795_08245 [Desulfuromonadaceae bacterium]
MVRMISLALMLMLTLGGCALYHKELDNNPPFSAHRFRYYDLEINWQMERQGDGAFRLAGTINDLLSEYLWDMELTARLIGPDGRVLARQTYTDFSTYVAPGKPESFRMEFGLPPGIQPERIHFSYYYWPIEAPPQFTGNKNAPSFGSFDSPP